MRNRTVHIVGWVAVAALIWGCTAGGDNQTYAPPPGSGGSGGDSQSASGGSGPVSPEGFVCQAGQTLCGDSCVFLDSNPSHCGSCNNVCPAGTTCINGVCSCQAGLTACSGQCVDLTSDAANCGACGTVCAAGEVCSLGTCSASCAAGLTQCGSSCVDLTTNPLHCGACDNACPGGRACVGGSCACDAGYTDCSGVCVDLTSDGANCGSCGNVCPAGTTCTAGACVTTTTATGGSGGGTTTTGGSSGTGGDATVTGGSSGTGGDTTGTGGEGTGGGGETPDCPEPTPGEGGVVIDGCCVVLCAYGDLTDPDADGVLDGWGWEMQAECVVPDSEVATGKDSCLPEPRTDLPEPGDGYWFPEVGDAQEPKCVPPCEDPASDAVGEPDGDGWGWEHQATCIVPGSRAAAEGIPCVPEGEECNGNGYVINIDGVDECLPPCQYGDLTDVELISAEESASGVEECNPDGDGWGWENGMNCIVSGSSAAPQSLCCDLPARTGLPPGGSGYMADIDGSGVFGDSEDEVCMPPCTDPASYEDSCSGWGYEDGLSCIAPDSIAAAQTVGCVYEALTTDPPTGDGWNGDYTTTFFGEDDCASLGADDTGNTNLNYSSCVGNGAISLNSDNSTWFGALGDHSTFWEGGECTCAGSEPCIPTCPNTTCGRCFEVACNPGGTYYHPDDENQDTHNGYCRTDQSVVVQIIDVCPHNHSNNTYWCTDQRPNHIDISCSAFTEITNGRQDIDNIGSLNVWVRQVDCSVGLGVKQITH